MGRRALAIGVTATAVAALALAVAAIADRAGPPERTVLERAAADGRHWRLETASGPVHVWVPAGYHADGAATVLYVHGLYTTIDQAWDKHRLAEQFALSSVNALFIAPEAPARGRDKISWTDLTALLTEVAAAIDVPRPMGAVVAISHSGGHTTVDRWLEHPALEVVIAVDSLYGDDGEVEAWLEASPTHRLIVIGDDTLRWTEDLAARLGTDVVTLDRFPEDDRGLPEEARRARVLYVRSQYGHMPLVTEGYALPMVLRLVPAELLAGGPWTQPYGLPPSTYDAGIDGGRR